jgi:Flp pilus assembly protein TadD
MAADPADLARAQTLIDLGRKRDAETILRTFLSQDTENARALCLLTQTMLGTGRTSETRGMAMRAVSSNPESEHAHRLLAIASSESGLFHDAETAAREAVRLAPFMWQTHFTLGSVLRESSGHGTKMEALHSALRAVEIAPHESMIHNLVGICYASLGDKNTAAGAYAEAIRLDPNNALAMNNLAALQMNRGKLTAASATLRSGLSAAPQEATLRRNYDVVLMKLMRRLYIALYVVFLLQISLASNGSNTSYWARIGLGLALITLCIASAGRVTRQLPRGAHLWARGLLGRVNTPQKILVIRFLLVLAVDILVAVTPSPIARPIGSIGFVAFIGLALAGYATSPSKSSRALRH